MMGSLYYEVTASGRRVALCVDKQDAEMVASHWYDGQVRELYALVMENPPYAVSPGMTYTYTLQPMPHVEPKRREE